MCDFIHEAPFIDALRSLTGELGLRYKIRSEQVVISWKGARKL